MVKGQFKKFIDRAPPNAKLLCNDVGKTLDLLAGLKCPRNFQRAYIATIRTIIEGEDSEAKKVLMENME